MPSMLIEADVARNTRKEENVESRTEDCMSDGSCGGSKIGFEETNAIVRRALSGLGQDHLKFVGDMLCSRSEQYLVPL